MTEEQDDGSVYFRVNNIDKANDLRKLFRFAVEEDQPEHYFNNAGKIIEEILKDEKQISFTKEQLDFITGLLLFLFHEKKHIMKDYDVINPDDLTFEVGPYFIADTQILLKILRQSYTK